MPSNKPKGLKVAKTDQMADRSLRQIGMMAYGSLIGMMASRYDGWQIGVMADRYDSERLRGFDYGQLQF